MTTLILLIHHQELARRFVAYVLEQHGYVVLSAAKSDEAESLLGRERPPLCPDAIVVGKDDLRELLLSPWRSHGAARQRVPLLVLGHVSPHECPSGVSLIAPDPRQLLLKLKSGLRNPAREAVLERDGLRVDPVCQEAMAGQLRLSLTPLGFRLLYFLMKHQGRVYSREQLLDQVWNDNGFVEERTVDVHICRLRNQLERYGYGHLIEAVRGSGYRFANAKSRSPATSGNVLNFAY